MQQQVLLERRAGRLIRMALGILLVASPAAVAGERSGPPGCAIDTVRRLPGPTGRVTISGWAFDAAANQMPDVAITSDSGERGGVRRGLPRDDVRTRFGRDEALMSGFFASLSLASVPPGTHAVELRVRNQDGWVTCGSYPISIPSATKPGALARIGWLGRVVGRAELLLLGLGLIGLPIILIAGPRRDLALAAPALGMAVFSLVAEAASRLGILPLGVGLGLLLLASVVSLLIVSRRRLPHVSPSVLIVLGVSAALALVAALPVIRYGDRTVFGHIDDGVRESATANVSARYGGEIPLPVRGYARLIPDELERVQVRLGPIRLLSLVAQASGSRAEDVHTATMLAAMQLVVLGVGLTARRFLRGNCGLFVAAAVIGSAGSSLLASVYSQHLGMLLFSGTFLAFVSTLLDAGRSRRLASILPPAALLAGTFSLYPETGPLWALALASVFLLARSRSRRVRSLSRAALIAVTALLLNPLGLLRFGGFVKSMTEEERRITAPLRFQGDTFVFPPVSVIPGFAVYRPDLPPPRAALGAATTALGLLSFAAVAFGAVARRRALAVRYAAWLALPLTLALVANRAIVFPYGYAKFVVLATPVFWICAFTLLRPALERIPRRRLAWAGCVLALLLGSGIWQTVHATFRDVPADEPAFRELVELARSVDPAAVVRITEPDGARRQWMAEYLGELAVEFGEIKVRYPGSPYYRLVDLREEPTPESAAPLRTETFALVPLGTPRDLVL